MFIIFSFAIASPPKPPCCFYRKLFPKTCQNTHELGQFTMIIRPDQICKVFSRQNSLLTPQFPVVPAFLLVFFEAQSESIQPFKYAYLPPVAKDLFFLIQASRVVEWDVPMVKRNPLPAQKWFKIWVESNGWSWRQTRHFVERQTVDQLIIKSQPLNLAEGYGMRKKMPQDRHRIFPQPIFQSSTSLCQVFGVTMFEVMLRHTLQKVSDEREKSLTPGPQISLILQVHGETFDENVVLTQKEMPLPSFKNSGSSLYQG